MYDIAKILFLISCNIGLLFDYWKILRVCCRGAQRTIGYWSGAL